MKCRRCGVRHDSCAQCKHEKRLHALEGCDMFRRGALPGCSCTKYIETTEETVCRLGAEKEKQWPQDALEALELLRARVHETHTTCTASGELGKCYVC